MTGGEGRRGVAQTYRGYSRTPDPWTRDTEPRLVILGHQPPESLATQTLTTQDPDANLFLHFFVKKKILNNARMVLVSQL